MFTITTTIHIIRAINIENKTKKLISSIIKRKQTPKIHKPFTHIFSKHKLFGSAVSGCELASILPDRRRPQAMSCGCCSGRRIVSMMSFFARSRPPTSSHVTRDTYIIVTATSNITSTDFSSLRSFCNYIYIK